MEAISPEALGWLTGQVPIVAGGPASGPQREPQLKRLLRFFVRWRWVLLPSIVVGLVLGLAATVLMTRQYASTVRLEISRDAAKVTKIEDVQPETSIGDQEFYQTQYGLLQATGLAERVAADLRLPDNRGFFDRFGREREFDAAGQLASPTAREAKRTGLAGEILLDHLTVAPMRGSSLVDVTVTTPDPALSQRIAAKWADDFVAMSLERRFDASSYARNFLEKRLEALRGTLETSERQAVEYADSQGIINLPQAPGTQEASGEVDRSPLTEKLEALNQALAVATADRIAAQSQLAAAQRPDASAEAFNNQAINDLRRQRSEVSADYAKTASEFGSAYPRVKALADQVGQIDASLNTETARVRTLLTQTYHAAAAREGALAAQVAGLKGQLNDVRQRSIQYNIFLRDADTNRQLYDSLLQRYKEIGVAGSVQDNNIAIINQPKVPDRPVSPRLLVNLIVAMFTGGLIGIALAAALNQIDETIGDPESVRSRLGLPLLGALPLVKDSEPIDELDSPRSPLTEGYLAVQANLKLATPHGTPKSIAFTSTRAREGKSTSAIALARLLAGGKKRVVLIDGDMRSPSLHDTFGISNSAGVSNLLAGSHDVGAVRHPTKWEGLSVIPAGPQPPSTADLLMGEGLHELVARLLTEFDHVVVDSPPVLGLADAPLVSAAVDAVVFVVEAGVTRSGAAASAIERLREARANLLGAVVTKFSAGRQAFAYDYGYGYGSERIAEAA
ncbi:MAG TPA: polysaccharide biosynthesis tyrosine autokinase [Croceibacterium sp.]|jgi:capsular exopolysaccharide synthesis family protein